MALDDFEPEGEEALDELLEDEDLFDFPSVEMVVESEDLDEAIVDEEDTDLLDDDSFPPEVVAAAAALQEELDAARPNDDEDLLDSLSASDADDEEGDLAFDDLLQENLIDEERREPTPAQAPSEPEPRAEQEDDDDTLDFSQLIPEEDEDSPELDDEFDALVAPAPRAAAVNDEHELEIAPRGAPARPAAAPPASKRTFVLVASGIALVNVLLVALGFYAVTEFSSGLEGLSRSMSDLVHEARAQDTQPVQAVPVAPADPERANTPTGSGEPRLPAFSRTELMTARSELDSGQFRSARQRLFRLLAAIDDPLADDAPEAEESANMLIAESYLLEARALEGDPR